MAEPQAILDAVGRLLGAKAAGPLSGRHVLITSGPTQEPIDPVRYIANRSSGKQGHALATAAVALGAKVTLVSGPVALPDPAGVTVVKVETAHEMLAATLAALPADIAICAAAVADWRAADQSPQKLKKQNQIEADLKLALNPDILATIAEPGPKRPRLVIGFAAETEKRVQIDVAFELDAQRADLDTADRGVGRVSHGQAVAERAEQLLDGVRRGVAPAESSGLVGGRGAEITATSFRAEAAVPAHFGSPYCLRGFGRLLDPSNEAADRLEIQVVE